MPVGEPRRAIADAGRPRRRRLRGLADASHGGLRAPLRDRLRKCVKYRVRNVVLSIVCANEPKLSEGSVHSIEVICVKRFIEMLRRVDEGVKDLCRLPVRWNRDRIR